MRVYGYMRASTKEQDATRAKEQLQQFAQDNGLTVASWFVENESGASLQRPELFRLLDVAQPGDVMLLEQVDRLSRLNSSDWQQLRGILQQKGLRVVALDLPTSHQLMTCGDEFTARMMEAITGMMMDMLAAIARKDYEDRRRRQAQGIAKAKAAGRYRGRPVNKELHATVAELLEDGKTYARICQIAGCSRATVARVSRDMRQQAQTA
ncbi:recombinase family protein [Zobellella sp. CGMCC 1.18722]|uniref:Recombinase family protein n=2 Tax=Zobellella iuensis TaxID=2803811 RepID=A0ABS1QN37_9GAMM|nr:recombinase family protein [Zobellella iuensis]MBL1376271.1 recombinase family protein [Zobellella iuensis]